MVNNDIFFPVRYEKSRPFINKLNPLFGHKSIKELNDTSFIMKVQNIIYDDIPEEPIIPIKRSLNQSEFEIQLARELNFYYQYHHWKTNGRNIFHFTKEILILFENTDVEELPLEKIKFPFKSLYLSFSDLERQYGIDSLDTKLYMDGVLITKDLAKENQIDLFMATSIKDSKLQKEWFYSNDYSSLKGGWFRINYDSEKNTLKKAGFIAKAFGKDRNEQKIEATQAIFWKYICLALNAVCYLTAEPDNKIIDWADNTPRNLIDKLKTAKTKHQKEIISTEIKNKGFTKINFIGQSFKRTAENATGKTLNTHWRRGHWRNLKIKIIWIQPTLVNSKKGQETTGHIYEV
jgi:hypothetical protein